MSIAKAFELQYGATLDMLRHVVDACPDALWCDAAPNRFWHVAYHALFYTHLYLQRSDKDFVAWTRHQTDAQLLDPRPWMPDAPLPVLTLYTQDDIRDYLAFCRAEVTLRLPAMEFDAPCGFPWLPLDTCGLQLYNLRHLAHHTGQLIERLRANAGLGTAWMAVPASH